MKMTARKLQGSPRRGLILRALAMLLVVAAVAGTLVTPASAASTERVSVEVGRIKYLRDSSSHSLAGATIVKNGWIWQSSNPRVADIITNNAPSCQIKGMSAGTAIISCTVYVTISRTNPITKRMELSYGSVMGSTYEVTVTGTGTNVGNGNGVGTAGTVSVYMKTDPGSLTFDLAAYGEQRVNFEVNSRAPTNYPEFQDSKYVTVRKSQSSYSIYKYTLTVGLTPSASVGNYTAEAVLRNSLGTIQDHISIPISVTCSHSYGSWTVTKEATCSESGKRIRTCRHCGDVRTETVPIAGHAAGTEWRSNGSQHWKVCASCGGKFDAASHEWGAGAVTRQASYTREGVKTYTCTVCGAVKTENTGYSGSSSSSSFGTAVQRDCRGRHSYDQGVVRRKATCGTAGEMVYTCVVCGNTRTRRISPTFDHEYDEGVVTRRPVGRLSGRITYTCVDCGYTKTRIIFR